MELVHTSGSRSLSGSCGRNVGSHRRLSVGRRGSTPPRSHDWSARNASPRLDDHAAPPRAQSAAGQAAGRRAAGGASTIRGVRAAFFDRGTRLELVTGTLHRPGFDRRRDRRSQAAKRRKSQKSPQLRVGSEQPLHYDDKLTFRQSKGQSLLGRGPDAHEVARKEK